MGIDINGYYEPEHFRAMNEDNYNISRTCEYEKNEMHHIHNSCEILLVEEGSASYFISGKKYHVEPFDILVIGSREHHQRRIDKLPFLRYGLTIKPSYCRSLMLEKNLEQVFMTPSEEEYAKHYKKIAPDIFNQIVSLLCYLKDEEEVHKPFRSQIERTVLTQIAVMLFRAFEFRRDDSPLTPSNSRMLEIKEYIDMNYRNKLDLKFFSEKFFLHPSTISKDFNKYCGQTLNKYINTVRICEAAKFLENTNESISAIAEKCGYDSENTFLRQFKIIMEISPLQYRKSVQEWFKAKKIGS